MAEKKTYGITELAALGGVSRRTVRYYVQRGLIPTPTGTGRGSHYGKEHLDALVKVRRLQENGVPLADIFAALSGEEKVTPEPPESAQKEAASKPRTHSEWVHIKLAEGLELHLCTSRFSFDDSKILRVIEAVRNVIK